MSKSLIGKRLCSLCSVSINDVPNGVSRIFLAHLPNSFRRWYGLKRLIDDLVKNLDEFIKKLNEIWCCHFHIDWYQRWIQVKATTAKLFWLWSLFRQWLVFLWRHNLISWHHCRMPSHGMLSFNHETCMLYDSDTKFFFEHHYLLALRSFIKTHQKLQSIFSPTLSNTNSSSTQLKVLSNWSKTTNLMFWFITSLIECVSKFLNVWMNLLGQRK